MSVEQRWGRNLTVGVEEELMVLDAATLQQVGKAAAIVEAERPARGEAKYELFASVVELATDICADAEDAAAEIRDLRRHALRIAGENGLALAAAGTHPTSISAEQAIAPDPRYLRVRRLRGADRAAPGRERVARAHRDARRRDVPARDGERRPVAAGRARRLGELAVVRGTRDGDAVDARRGVVAAAAARRAAAVRVVVGVGASRRRVLRRGRRHRLQRDPLGHAAASEVHGTLEIRIADQPTDIERTAAFVAILRALCAWGAQRELPPADPLRRVVYDQNRWAAARFGPRATLIHPDGDGGISVAELWRELVERVGVDPHVDASVCEGDAQLDIGRSEGLDALTASLVARSVT